MYQHHTVQRHISQADLAMLACLIPEPKTATAWYEAVLQATGEVIEPGAFSRMLARLERRGWIEASGTDHPLRLYQITEEGALVHERSETHRHKEKLQEGRYPDWPRGRKIIMQLVLWLLRLYPSAWRERYEAEMVALLEQHQITLWTVLDLLLGALDARTDPHYRRAQLLLPWRQLKISWKLYASALAAFCFTLLLWLNMGDLGQNLAGTGDSCTSPGYYYPRCMMRLAVAVQTPPVASAIVISMSLLAFLLVLLLLLALVLWVVMQAILRKNAWNLLRLLPLASFLLLLLVSFTAPPLPGWLNGLVSIALVASVALLVESGGAMFVSGNRWDQRPNWLLALFVRLLALLVVVSMFTVCIAGGAWLLALWNLFPRINLYYPGTQTQLLVGLSIMTLASVSAFFALIRGACALKAVYAAHLPQRGRRTDPKVGIIVLFVGLFAGIGPMLLGFTHSMPTRLLWILLAGAAPVFAVLGSMLIVRAVKQNRGERADLPYQEPLQQVQQSTSTTE